MSGSPFLRRSCALLLTVGAFALLTRIPSMSFAQSVPDAVVPEESLSISQGDIFEAIGQSDDAAGTFTWVLTKDRIFVQAGRESLFRVRPVETGEERLDATAMSGDGYSATRRIFLVDVRSRTPQPWDSSSSSSQMEQDPNALIATDPPLIGDVMELPIDRQMVALRPQNPSIQRISVDLDTTVDSDGNGDPTDDQDSANTYFESNLTPLFVWFSSQRQERSIRISAIMQNGEVQTQTFRIYAEGTVPPPVIDTTQTIHVEIQTDGSLKFSLNAGSTFSDIPVLLHWQLGDGTESLRDAPTHLYTQSGSYAVSVSATDLRTGQQIYSTSTTVTVEAYITPVITSSSSSSSLASPVSSSSSSVAGTTKRGTFGPMLLLGVKILLVILGLLLLAGGGVWIATRFLRRSGGSLQRTLEDVESRIMKTTQPGGNVLDIAPPMEIRREAKHADAGSEPMQPAAELHSPPEKETPPQEPAPPTLDTPAEVPIWLRKGLDAPLPTIVTTPPTIDTAAPATGDTAPPPVEGPVPDWLRPAPIDESPPTPVAPKEETTPPASAADATPTWLQPTPPTTPAPASEPPASPTLPPADAVVPPWLQQSPPPPEPSQPLPSTPEPTARPEPASLPQPTTPVATKKESMQKPKPISEPNQSVTDPSAPPPKTHPEKKPNGAPPPPTPAATDDPAAREREEKERERKRKKRQRYRENLKKRKTEDQPPSSPATPIVPEETANVPVPAEMPAKTVPKSGAPVKLPAPAEVKETIPPIEDETPQTSPATKPAPKEEEMQRAPADVKPSQPSPAATPEDKVVFVLEAEGLQHPKGPDAKRLGDQ